MIKTCGLALLNNLLTLKHFSRIPHKFFYGRLFQKCMSTCSQVFFRIAVLENWESSLESNPRLILIRDHSFSTHAKFSEKLTFLFP